MNMPADLLRGIVANADHLTEDSPEQLVYLLGNLESILPALREEVSKLTRPQKNAARRYLESF